MSEKAMEYFRKIGLGDRIQVFEQSSATVELAAEAIGCTPGEIAKSITFYGNEGGAVLIVAAGDAKTDNGKFKAEFAFKPKMLTPQDVEEKVGYSVGGVCPYSLNEGVSVYLDESLRRFEKVYTACGTSNSVIGLSLSELMQYSGALKWVDVCKGWE